MYLPRLARRGRHHPHGGVGVPPGSPTPVIVAIVTLWAASERRAWAVRGDDVARERGRFHDPGCLWLPGQHKATGIMKAAEPVQLVR